MLDKFQERYGYRLIVLEKIRYENHIISSTYTKKILGTGNMESGRQTSGLFLWNLRHGRSMDINLEEHLDFQR